MEIAEAAVRSEAAGAPIDLRVEGLRYHYARFEVWKDVSFALREGAMALLVGQNGSGKSTLLNCLAGWSVPTERTIEVLGARFDGSNQEARAQIAFVPDFPSFYDDLIAAEHFRLVYAANRIPAGEQDGERLLAALGLTAHADQLPLSYSRGMRQKLGLALALAAKPRLLLLDEPYGPLDREASANLTSLLDEARANGVTVLASIHHDVVGLQADLLLRLKDGGLTAQPLDGDARAERAGRP